MRSISARVISNGLVNAWDGNFADEFRMAAGESLDACASAGFPMQSATSIVKKSEGGEEAVDGFEPDMVGVHMVGFFPAQSLHGGIRRGPVLAGSEPTKCVRGWICSRQGRIHAELGGQDTGVKLGPA